MAEPSNSEFKQLVKRCRDGDLAAIRALVERYEPDIRIIVRARLGVALRPYLDSVDLVQSVHRSVLAGLRNRQFDFDTPEQLIALAAMMVRRKTARCWRKHRRQQRVDTVSSDAEPLRIQLIELQAADDDPQRMAEITDLVDHLLERIDSQDEQLIQMRIQGYTTIEAARSLGLDPDVTRVRLSRIRRRLRDLKVVRDLC